MASHLLGECPEKPPQLEWPERVLQRPSYLSLDNLSSTMASSSKVHWLYILRCADESLYIGETNDVARRVAAHNEGRSSFTSTRRPVSVVYREKFEIRSLALKRERQLKTWSRSKKEAMIAGDLIALKRL